MLSGIVFVSRNGLSWCDASNAYGPHKTPGNRWKRRGERGVFLRMLEGLSAVNAEPRTIMIDTTCLKARHTTSDPGIEEGSMAA